MVRALTMAISAEVMHLENESLGPRGAPTLGAAFELLREAWERGDRDRELALHLMFLAWYLAIEPPHLTGLDEARRSEGELPAMFNEAHDWLLPSGVATQDAEALYAAGLPAHMFAWALGDERLWTIRSDAYRHRYRELAPDGIPPEVFEGRGAYGDYYAGQARVPGGY